MHKMYENVWKCAKHIGEKCPFSSKSWFLFFSICIWTVIGMAATAAIMVVFKGTESSLDKLVWELVGTGYAATVFGFGGGVMYILRNTSPDDIK